MSDFDDVFEQCRRSAATGTVIDKDTARRVAGMYHTGQMSAALTLATTGEVRGHPDDIWDAMFDGVDLDDRGRLIAAQMRIYLHEEAR